MKLLDFIYSDCTDKSVAEIKEELLEFYNIYNVNVANLQSDTVYRVRKIVADTPHQTASDLWHPPPERITRINRANDINDPVFYCSLDAATAIEEAQIAPGDHFSLAIYHLAARRDYNMTSVVIKESLPLSGNAEEFSRFGSELSRFMVREFTQPVTKGNENLYKRSCAIAKILFDLPYKDSIIYPSVKDPESINVALLSEAATERLKLIQVVTCIKEDDDCITATVLSKPDPYGCLVAESPSHPMPAKLRLTDAQMRFSSCFSDNTIATPGEIFSHHIGKIAGD